MGCPAEQMLCSTPQRCAAGRARRAWLTLWPRRRRPCSGRLLPGLQARRGEQRGFADHVVLHAGVGPKAAAVMASRVEGNVDLRQERRHPGWGHATPQPHWHAASCDTHGARREQHARRASACRRPANIPVVPSTRPPVQKGNPAWQRPHPPPHPCKLLEVTAGAALKPPQAGSQVIPDNLVAAVRRVQQLCVTGWRGGGQIAAHRSGRHAKACAGLFLAPYFRLVCSRHVCSQCWHRLNLQRMHCRMRHSSRLSPETSEASGVTLNVTLVFDPESSGTMSCSSFCTGPRGRIRGQTRVSLAGAAARMGAHAGAVVAQG